MESLMLLKMLVHNLHAALELKNSNGLTVLAVSADQQDAIAFL